MSISVVGDSRIWIQRDGPPGLPFATAPVPIVPDESERKRGMSFREEVIKLIEEAVPLYIATLRQKGEPIPPPTTTALTVPIATA